MRQGNFSEVATKTAAHFAAWQDASEKLPRQTTGDNPMRIFKARPLIRRRLFPEPTAAGEQPRSPAPPCLQQADRKKYHAYFHRLCRRITHRIQGVPTTPQAIGKSIHTATSAFYFSTGAHTRFDIAGQWRLHRAHRKHGNLSGGPARMALRTRLGIIARGHGRRKMLEACAAIPALNS